MTREEVYMTTMTKEEVYIDIPLGLETNGLLVFTKDFLD